MGSNEVLVITGMSGAGKSTVSHALEDLGWYVVDNLPPSMIATLCEMAVKTPSAIAVVIDVRGGQFFDDLTKSLSDLGELNIARRILFVDASKRFGKGKAQNYLTDEDVEDIFAVYQSLGEAEKENISGRLVSHNEIEENNWDLNIGRYLKADAAEVVDVQDALASFDQARTELAAAEKVLLAKLKAAGYA